MEFEIFLELAIWDFIHDFMKRLIKNLHAGYTMIEMLVVMSIIVIMSVALFANYREIGDQGRVSSFTGKLREDLYLAQNYSLGGRINNYGVPNGWGVYFNRNLNEYIIFSDFNGNKTYDYPTKLLIHGTEWTSGTTFTDSSQAANTVTLNGNAAQVASPGMPTGSGNGYWQFDGTGDGLSVPDSSNFDFGANDFGIDLWVNSDSTGSKKYIMSKGSGASKVYELYKDTDNKIYFVIYDTPLFASSTLASLAAITRGAATHIAVTRYRNIITLFIDGVPQSKVRMSTAVRVVSSNVIIGADNDGTSNSWSGLIDEVRISKETSRWREKFTPPNAIYRSTDESFREVKLPPGLVFDYLKLAGATTTELNIFFDLSSNQSSKPTYLMYGNGNAGDQEVQIVINNAGVAGTSLAGDTPQTLTIDKSGAINWTR